MKVNQSLSAGETFELSEQPVHLSQPILYFFQPFENGLSNDRLSNADSYQKSKDYFCWSLFNTFCCCFILGIFAISFSHKVRELNRKNPLDPNVEEYSNTALRLNTVSTIFGVIFIFYFLMYQLERLVLK